MFLKSNFKHIYFIIFFLYGKFLFLYFSCIQPDWFYFYPPLAPVLNFFLGDAKPSNSNLACDVPFDNYTQFFFFFWETITLKFYSSRTVKIILYFIMGDMFLYLPLLFLSIPRSHHAKHSPLFFYQVSLHNLIPHYNHHHHKTILAVGGGLQTRSAAKRGSSQISLGHTSFAGDALTDLLFALSVSHCSIMPCLSFRNQQLDACSGCDWSVEPTRVLYDRNSTYSRSMHLSSLF